MSAAGLEQTADNAEATTSSSPLLRRRAVIPSPALKYLRGSSETPSESWASLDAELALAAPLAPRARQMPTCSSSSSSGSQPSRSRAASSSPAAAASSSSSPSPPLHLLELPDDLFFHIFDYLSTVCLLRVSGQPPCRPLRRLVLLHAAFDLDLDRILGEQQPSRSLTQSKSSYAPLVSQALQFEQLSVLTLASFGPLLSDSLLQPILNRHAPSLLSLSLRSNDLITPCIASSSLTSLDLSRNRRLQCPRLCCASLTQLDLSRTFVNDLDLGRSCEGCGQLRVLRLQGCKNVRLLPLSLPHLRIVDLSATAVLDDAVQRLSAQSPGLRVLFLNDCAMLRSPLLASSTLTALSLRSCEGLRSASLLCPVLRELDVSDTGLSDAALAAALSSPSQLRVLSLRQCDQLAVPVLTADLPLLESLELSMSAVHLDGVRSFMARATQLQSLQAGQCVKLTDGLGSDAALLSSSLSSLRDLNLRFSAVSQLDVDALLTACPVLSRLNISSCMLVTALSSCSSSLRHLDMTCCPVDDAAFSAILASSRSASSCLFPRLLTACFDQCNSLLSASARHPQLQELRLAGCRSLESLSIDCPSLSALDVSSCMALSALSLSAHTVSSLRLVQARHLAGYALAAVTAQLTANSEVEMHTMSQSIADSAYQPMARRQRREAAAAGTASVARRQRADRQAAASSSRPVPHSASPSSAATAVSPSATSTASDTVSASNPHSPSSSPSSSASPSPVASHPNHSIRSSPRPIERRREQREEEERSGSGSPSRLFQPSPPVRSRYLDASPRQQRSHHRHAASTTLLPPSAPAAAVSASPSSSHCPLTPPVSMRRMLTRTALSASSTPSSPAGRAASPASGSQSLPPHSLAGSFAMSGVVLPATAQDLTRAVSPPCSSSSTPSSASSSSISSSASQPLPSSPHRSLPFSQAVPPLALCSPAPSLPDTRSSLSVLLKPLPAPLPRSSLVAPCFPPASSPAASSLPCSKRLDSRASSLSSVDCMPRFLLNSIDVYILNASIASIQGKLAADDRQQQQQSTKGGKSRSSASAASASSSSPSFNTSGLLLSAAARYGLKRQLAMLRARLKREERLLVELAAVQHEDGGDDAAGVGIARRKLSS